MYCSEWSLNFTWFLCAGLIARTTPTHGWMSNPTSRQRWSSVTDTEGGWNWPQTSGIVNLSFTSTGITCPAVIIFQSPCQTRSTCTLGLFLSHSHSTFLHGCDIKSGSVHETRLPYSSVVKGLQFYCIGRISVPNSKVHSVCALFRVLQ